MAILKCKMCGGDLEVTQDMTVAECEYCRTKQTVPTADDEKKMKLFERANRLRSNCEFDKAAGVYENIVADYSEEAEGYWGLLLCRYGIEYVDDPATGKKIPTCHRSSFDSIMDDEDFELVMENSDAVSRAVYREEAKYIEELRKGIIEVSGKEAPYDIFICYKETDENGERTLDSVLAQDVYDALTEKGYRVFFSRITLEDKLGVEYEPYIFAALNSAKVMLAFGTSYDYYNAVWVKNEWSRYLKLMAKDKSRHLIPCFKNVDAYDIPKEFAKLQAQDMGKIGAVQDLMRGIDKLIRLDSKAEQGAIPENVVVSSTGANGNALLKRGFMALEDKEWSKATDFFEQVLNTNAEEGLAYWGELLAAQKCSDAEGLCEILYRKLADKIKEVTLEAKIADRYPEFSRKYCFLSIFNQQEIEQMFCIKFSYQSQVASIEKIIAANRECFVLADSRLYQRAVQYADANLKSEIDQVIQDIDAQLQERLEEVKAEKEESMNSVIAKADTYFEELDSVLEIANQVVSRNAKKNEAAYQEDLAKWTAERDSLESRRIAWQKEMVKYREDYAAWKAVYGVVIERWDEDKRKYAQDKKKLEEEIERLVDQKRLIDGFAAELRLKKANEAIYRAEKQLRSLVIPEEPDRKDEPKQPVEPVLREKPVLTFEDKIGKEEVRKVFFAEWNK